MVKFATNASGAIWLTIASGILFGWRDNSSLRFDTLGPLCLWQCFLFVQSFYPPKTETSFKRRYHPFKHLNYVDTASIVGSAVLSWVRVVGALIQIMAAHLDKNIFDGDKINSDGDPPDWYSFWPGSKQNFASGFQKVFFSSKVWILECPLPLLMI